MFGSKGNITESQFLETVTPLLKRVREMEQLIKKHQQAIDGLQAQVAEMKDAIDRKPAANNGAQQPSAERKEDGHRPKDIMAEEVPAVLYLSAPTPDGAFTEASTEELIGKSIYVLHTDDGRHGTFCLNPTNDAMATAMISVSQFIKPVCRVQGDTHHMPGKIDTIEKGTAENKDGTWVMTRKAVVAFGKR